LWMNQIGQLKDKRIIMRFRKWLGCVFVLLALTGCVTNKPDDNKKDLHAASAYNASLGLGYLKQGHVERAKAKLLLALAQDDRNATAYAAMAYFLERTGDQHAAESYYQKALRIAPDEGELLNNYGAYLCRAHHYDTAEHYFLRAATQQQYVNTVAAYENAALCALDAKQYDKAHQYFEKALAQDGLRARSLWELSRLDQQLGRPQEAYNALRRYLIIQKNPDADVLTTAIHLARQTGDIEGMQHYQELLKKLETSGVRHG
jgi:type IV pilus assembly protein PilF